MISVLLRKTSQSLRSGSNLRPLNLESSTQPLSNCVPRLILMVYILSEMNSNAKKQYFIYFSSVSHEISVNLIKRCHYSRYTILTNRSTRVLPSTTIRRIPQLFCFNRLQLKIIKPRPDIKLGWCKLHIEIGN